MYHVYCTSYIVCSQNEGFCQIHTPILTSNDCEGAGEVFKVEVISDFVIGIAICS